MFRLCAAQAPLAFLVATVQASALAPPPGHEVPGSLPLMGIVLGVALFVVCGAAWGLARARGGASPQPQHHAQQTAPHQAEHDRLERLVAQRTASLGELATHLQTVREDERAHLARELHDELGALLTAAKLDLARLKGRWPDPPPEVAERFQHLADTLDRGISLKRRIVEDLWPSALTHLGLKAAVDILAKDVAVQAGLALVVQIDEVPQAVHPAWDATRQLTVYRLVQEAMTNVVKHAKASRVTLSVLVGNGVVMVSVVDDGVGFDVSGARPTSHGLSGMHHRVLAAGGQLKIETAVGGGTRVHAEFPLGNRAVTGAV